jgi:hypothetical protein
VSGKRKPAETPTRAQPDRPRSSDPERIAIRIDGITYSIPAEQVEQFKARYAGRTKRDAHAEIYE